jgi:hypothetical protein
VLTNDLIRELEPFSGLMDARERERGRGRVGQQGCQRERKAVSA